MTSNSLIHGSVIKSLFKLSLPIVMANFIQTTYQLTDTFWVGRLGTDSVAALSLSFPVIFLLVSIGGGFTVSGTILVSQLTGKKDTSNVSNVCFQTLIITSVVSVILGVLAYYITPYLVNSMTSDPSVRTIATSYLQVSFYGLIFSYLYMMFQSLYRGAGDVKTPFIIVCIAVVLNFILDPFFIMGIGPIKAYGTDGAAYVTIITQGIAAVAGLILLIRGKGALKLDFKKSKLDFKLIKKIISLGIPASTEQSSRALAMMVMIFLVASFGTVPLAAYGIGIRILSFIIIPSLGFSMATSTLVGQNIGAENYERTKEIVSKSLLIIFFTLGFSGLCFFIFAEEALALFVPNSPDVILEGASFIKIIALTFGLVGINQVSAGALRGGGNPLVPMFVSLITLWVVRFPIAFILSHHTSLGQKGIYWSFVFSNIIAAVVSLTIIKRNRWMRNLSNQFTDIEIKVLEETITEEGRHQ